MPFRGAGKATWPLVFFIMETISAFLGDFCNSLVFSMVLSSSSKIALSNKAKPNAIHSTFPKTVKLRDFEA